MVEKVGLGAATPVIPGVSRLQLIGRGGSGAVYRGMQEQFGREVAIKVLAAPAASGDDLARWRRELTAVGRLSNHPNIVAVFDSGTTADGLPYMVMPYVPGGTLGDRVRRQGPLAANDAAELGAKIAGALAAAHDAGVLHRDVKPDNVLLSPYGEPQLADFGIARLVDSNLTATSSGLIHATINYAAPEVLSGERATAAADVYGLAATLYFAVTGDVPFPHDPETPRVGVVYKIVHDPRPDPAAQGVPADLAAVIGAGLAQDPADRPSVREFQQRLSGLGGVEAPEPEPTVEASAASPPTVRVAPTRRRGRAPVLLLAFLLVVAVSVAVVAALAQRKEPEPTPSVETTTGRSSAVDNSADRPSSARQPSVRTAASRYFTLLADADYASAYAMLSPGFRAIQSQSSYEQFWRSVSPVELVGQPSVDGLVASVPIRMAGRPHTYGLHFTRGSGGTLYVDGPRPGS